MRRFLKCIEYILHEISFLLTGKDVETVSAGAADYSGQGRDKYGR